MMQKISKQAESNDKLYNIYFNWQEEYQAKYGQETVVLCQVGAFFEIYGVDNEVEQVGVADQVASILNIQCTLKNKKKGPSNDRKNPKMCGFQPPYLHRHLEILLANNWTVVIIEQVTPPPNPKREITRIYSPGTYIDNETRIDNNYVASIFIESGKCLKTNMALYMVGLSAIDVSTGENVVHYFDSSQDDKQIIEGEIFRFIEAYNPKEVIINTRDLTTKDHERFLECVNNSNRIKYENTLGLDSKSTSEVNVSELFKVTYQNQFLNKIFPNTGFLSPIEFLNLEKSPASVLSYIVLLQFVYEHSPKIIEKINKPDSWCENQNLILNNNTIYQLDILQGNQIDSHPRFKSVFHVIDQTKTPMGRRLLKFHLLNPIYNVEELNRRYSLIKSLINGDDNGNATANVKMFQQSLEEIMDIERRHRKMFLKLLQPHELAELYVSYQSILTMFDHIDKFYSLSNDFSFASDYVTQFKEFLKEYTETFDLEIMIKYNLNSVDQSFFQPGRFPEVDVLQAEIEKVEGKLQDLASQLSDLIEKGSNYVVLDKTDREGYFFRITTTSRVNALQKALKKNGFNEGYLKNIGEKLDFKKVPSSNMTKVYLLDDSMKILQEMRDKIRHPITNAYNQMMDVFYDKYSVCFQAITRLIARVDVVVSHAKTALLYSYHLPVIQDRYQECSYVDIKALRHPIAERIHTKTNYVANDIRLGCQDEEDNCNGFLLFGINSAGKSCLLKSVGVSVIMAQIGMYVPASNFIYYPFHAIFSRISGDDNIFKGKSSFTIEMQEMKTILKYSNQLSLVLGDEICKGTEHVAALSIVAAALKWFSKNNTKFILATHLHQLSEIDVVKQLDNLSLKHLEIKYDKKDECFIYNRKLKEGSGESIYGLEVAKYIVDQPEFIKSATQIRNSILNNMNPANSTNAGMTGIGSHLLLNTIKSNFSKEVYNDICQVCGSNEKIEQHHIIFQSQCDQNGFAEHIPKNNPSNLAFLCKKHHIDVHQDRLELNGYAQTSLGITLRFRFLSAEETKKKRIRSLKFSEEDVNTVKQYKGEGMTLALVAYYLKKNHGLLMSKGTIRKIFNGDYDAHFQANSDALAKKSTVIE